LGSARVDSENEKKTWGAAFGLEDVGDATVEDGGTKVVVACLWADEGGDTDFSWVPESAMNDPSSSEKERCSRWGKTRR